MALRIKNVEVLRLAEELAKLSGVSKTEAIRHALMDRKDRISTAGSGPVQEDRLRQFLELRVWPLIPEDARQTWSKDNEDAALGYGEWGQPE